MLLLNKISSKMVQTLRNTIRVINGLKLTTPYCPQSEQHLKETCKKAHGGRT